MLGLLTFTFIAFIFLYYFSSGMSNRYPLPSLVKNIDRVILDKYLGISIFELDDYLYLKISSISHKFTNKKPENVRFLINQENLYGLELQRKEKLNSEPNLEILRNYSLAELSHKNEKYRIKLRVKGDRLMHYYDKESTSYKVDIRGEKRIWGLEEFSIQKPIARNYIYEYIFHKVLESNNLISLKYFFVNLYINDTPHGLYAIEEGFSKELIERNKRRNGPIFGLDEILSDGSGGGITFPYVQYDLYSKNYWLETNPDMTKIAISKLNKLKKNEIAIEEIFELEKWAKFFAVIDLTNAIHGAITKSVKLYYNPVIGKFEPIGFDGHYGDSNIEDFLLLDFIDPKSRKCGYICHEREWFLRFFQNSDGKLNEYFIGLYLEELKKISSKEFIDEFNKKFLKNINLFNSQIYSDGSKKDRGRFKGVGYYVYDKNYLLNRSNYIKKRLNSINQIKHLQVSLDNESISFYNTNHFFFKKINIECNNETKNSYYIILGQKINYDKNCNYLIGDQKLVLFKNIFMTEDSELDFLNHVLDLSSIKELRFDNGVYFLNQDLNLKNNYFFPKNKKLVIKEGVNLIFSKDVILSSEGSILFEGTEENPIRVYGENGKGSIIFQNNTFKFNNVEFSNLSYPKDSSKTLYGGINIINSKVHIKNTLIKNSNSEDAINIISSDSSIDKLTLDNIKADAVDIDFGEIEFNKIQCNNIFNDCLDVSGANIKGKFLKASNVSDKGISFGEKSNGLIEKTELDNNKLGIAVKDGSELILKKNSLMNNEIDIAVFNKKKEYDSATLNIISAKNPQNLKVLLGKRNIIKSELNLNIEKVKNSYINDLIY